MRDVIERTFAVFGIGGKILGYLLYFAAVIVILGIVFTGIIEPH